MVRLCLFSTRVYLVRVSLRLCVSVSLGELVVYWCWCWALSWHACSLVIISNLSLIPSCVDLFGFSF